MHCNPVTDTAKHAVDSDKRILMHEIKKARFTIGLCSTRVPSNFDCHSTVINNRRWPK